MLQLHITYLVEITFVRESEIGTLLKFKKQYGEAEHQVIKISIQRVENDGETKTTTITSASRAKRIFRKGKVTMSKEIHLANWDGEKFIDRLYQSFDKSIYMIQADGSTYYGAIKTITTKGKFGMTQVSFTEDNRWFDRSGMPIPKPDHIDLN